jgi:DNA-directed RNA polymerase III subunit RPC4
MPPKTATGRARGTGTRGRGGRGGRGAAAATASNSTPTEQPATDAAPATEASTAAPVAQMTTAPVANMASEPTSTTEAAPAPAPAPAPAAIKRVASVRRGGASASPAPSASRGKKPIVPAPKAVRRSKEDRDALQKEANLKKAEEARAALRDAKRAGRGRGDRGRGRGGGKARGGFMGDSERTIRDVVASGPFSAGQVAADAGYRGQRRGVGGGGSGFGGGGGGGSGGGYSGGSGGGGSSSGGGSRIKSEGGSHSYGNIAIEDGGYISSDLDEADEGPRKDIDFINLLSDDEQDTATTNSGMAPIRVNRVEHRERERPVAADASKSKAATTDPSSTTGAASGDATAATTTKERTASPELVRTKQPRAKEVQVVRSERKWKGAWEDSSDDDLAIKPEPMDDDNDLTAAPLPSDTDTPAIKESASPESRRKSKGKAAARKHTLPTEAPALQTVEERREWERHHLDLEILRQELGEITLPSSIPAVSSKDAEGDVKMGEDATTTEEADLAEGVDATSSLPTSTANGPPPPDRRTDRVYLFQFPPILPSLAPTTVKPEPVSPTLSKKVPVASTSAIDVDATSTTAAKHPEIPESAGQMHSPFPSGLVGKLRVHASGRTTLDWGGTSLQVGMGTDVQFLQDAVVAKFNDKSDVEGAKGKEEEHDETAFGGEVMGLGQVRGKFVVTPDWEEIVGVRI